MVNAIPTDAGHPATMEDSKDLVLRETAATMIAATMGLMTILHEERERRKLDLEAIKRLTRESIGIKKDLDAALGRCRQLEEALRRRLKPDMES
ncbi:MAG: hypothetical protein BWX86_00599 [Verrucomicrobia bacterium ADurb.Bin122]|nr:MAG: hypothetical protein BWX86_00599 [Verrucomicrobia bacterium ADurb.Bin122]